MNRIRPTLIYTFILMAFGSSCILFTSCINNSMEGMIICTQGTGNGQNTSTTASDFRRYFTQTRIIAFDTINPERSVKVLTKDFFSARSPEVSPDGDFLLFTAQKKQNDPWQIFEMNLNDLKTRQITSSPENCLDPAYLPGERVVFSRISQNDTLSLFTCNLNGTGLIRITFNSYKYSAPVVLKDGRVLTLCRPLHIGRTDQQFTVLRPDGTKADLFYRGTDGSEVLTKGLETSDGKIVFIEGANSALEEGDITAINYNRPLHSRVNLTSGINGNFSSVFPMKSGKLLVSWRQSDADMYSLFEFDPEKLTMGRNLYNNKEYNVFEAVMVDKHERPKKLPSEVDMGVKTGLLLCQDINLLEQQSTGNSSSSPKASGIEIIGVDSTLGTVRVEEDGSFYLKVIADTPFQIRTVDDKGNVVHGPGGWIWLRPNERRGCIGCHQDPEMVPGNKVPLAVKKSPVNIPVHINKVIEKKVSLE